MSATRLLLACSLVLLPCFSACNSGDSASAGTGSSVKQLKGARAPVAEHSVVLSVPDMGDVISANRASKALLAVPSVTGADTSVQHKTITVTSSGAVAPVMLIKALSEVGFSLASCAKNTVPRSILRADLRLNLASGSPQPEESCAAQYSGGNYLKALFT